MFFIVSGAQPLLVIFETWSNVFTSTARRPMFSRQTSFAAAPCPICGFLKVSFLSSMLKRNPAITARCMRKS